MFSNVTKDALSLISQLLCLDPKKRLTADEALKHEFFSYDCETPDELKALL